MAGSLREALGLSRWGKESRKKEKAQDGAQDGSETPGGVASANPSEGTEQR
jgi:hypothetical protein